MSEPPVSVWLVTVTKPDDQVRDESFATAFEARRAFDVAVAELESDGYASPGLRTVRYAAEWVQEFHRGSPAEHALVRLAVHHSRDHADPLLP
jgi:hypothetical protein